MVRYFAIIALLLCYSCANAQLTASAGNDTTICQGSPLRLGAGTPAVNGIPPYTVYWNGPGLINDTTTHPLVLPLGNSIYTLTVTDANNNTVVDNINISVQPPPVVTITPDTVLCQGELIGLNASIQSSIQSCGLYSFMGAGVTSPENADTFITVGSPFQPPALLGNFYNGNRTLMLYKAAELANILSGPCFIQGMSLRVTVFNSQNIIENYAISMGCTNIDSLTNWVPGLVTVFPPQSVGLPLNFTGQKWFSFSQPFYWDGTSDILIEVCHYTTQQGSFQNGVAFSPTAFKSLVWSRDSTNQCNIPSALTAMSLRPVVAFRYFNTPFSSYQWSPATGPNRVFQPWASSTLANVYQSTSYTFEGQQGACRVYDTVKVTVDLPPIALDTLKQTPSCFSTNTGALNAIIQPSHSVYYILTTANYSDTINSGLSDINGQITINGLAAGNYALMIADTGCLFRQPITVSRMPELQTVLTADTKVRCAGDSNANACITITNSTAPYQYFWDLLPSANSCIYGLGPGPHRITIIDSFNCSKTQFFNVLEPPLLEMQILNNSDGIAPDTISITAIGGTAPYFVYWNDSTGNSFNSTIQHIYQAEFPFQIVTVTDSKGCSVTDTVYNFYAGVEEPENTLLQVFPNPAGSIVNIGSTKTIQAVTIINNMGRQVLYTPANNNFIMVDIKSLAPGLYLLKIETEGITTYRKLRKTEG